MLPSLSSFETPLWRKMTVGDKAHREVDTDACLDAWQGIDSDEGVSLAVAKRVFIQDSKPIIEELKQVLAA